LQALCHSSIVNIIYQLVSNLFKIKRTLALALAASVRHVCEIGQRLGYIKLEEK